MAESIEKYDRPSVTADVVAIEATASGALSLLLVRRGRDPFQGFWALPGGFFQRGDTIEECAQRELWEETSLENVPLYPLGCFSAPGRDPRGWIISNAFLAPIPSGKKAVRAGDDAADARWFSLEYRREEGSLFLKLTQGDLVLHAELKEKPLPLGCVSFEVIASDLAFDHAQIVTTALHVLDKTKGLLQN